MSALPQPRLPRLPRVRLSARWRWSLWSLMVVLVGALLVTLVWLAGRYEASQVQSKLERDTADAVADVRNGLTRNIQTLQALHAANPATPAWAAEAAQLLRSHREWMRIEWRDARLVTLLFADTPYRQPVFARLGRANASADVAQACTNARRISAPAYSASYFVPQIDGLGVEVMELCMPQVVAGEVTGYLVATYSLQEILTDMVPKPLARSQDVSFTEADGTRLALHGSARRASCQCAAPACCLAGPPAAAR